MRSLQALGLVLVVIGGMVILGAVALRPLGYTLTICGGGLVIFGFRRPRSTDRGGRREPYSWDSEDPGAPPELYEANPGEVVFKTRTTDAVPGFTTPAPGAIPTPRQPPSGGSAEYTASAAEVPPPRERQRAEAEYTAPVVARDLDEDVPHACDAYHQPMAPPPPPP